MPKKKMPEEKSTKQLNICMPQGLYDRLEKTANETYIPKSTIIKLLLNRYLDDFLEQNKKLVK